MEAMAMADTVMAITVMVVMGMEVTMGMATTGITDTGMDMITGTITTIIGTMATGMGMVVIGMVTGMPTELVRAGGGHQAAMSGFATERVT